MFNNEQERKVFFKTIRELTFIPSISTKVLGDSVSENRLGRENFDVEVLSQKSSHKYIDEYKRNQRLFEILSKSNSEKEQVSNLIQKDKIYDDVLKNKQISLYNYMADKIGLRNLGDNPPSIKVLSETAQMDGGDPDDPIISEFYPYYYRGERDGVDFIEYILLLNISLITRSRTQTFFANQLKKPSDEKGIHRWIKRVSTSMHSEALYMSYVDTFFSTFYYVSSRQFNDNLKCWQSLIGNEDEQLRYYYQYQRLFERMDGEPHIREMQTNIMPVIWCMLNADNTYNYKSEADKRWLEYQDKKILDIAKIYVSIIRDYINQAILEAESILPTLFDI